MKIDWNAVVQYFLQGVSTTTGLVMALLLWLLLIKRTTKK